MDRDPRECVERRRGTEERLVPVRDVDTARVRVETWQDGVIESRVLPSSQEWQAYGQEAAQESHWSRCAVGVQVSASWTPNEGSF